MSDNLMNKKPKHGERCMNQCDDATHEARSPLELSPEILEKLRQAVYRSPLELPPEIPKPLRQNVYRRIPEAYGELADSDYDYRAEEFRCVEDDYDDEPYYEYDGELYDEDEEEDEPITLTLNDCGEEFEVRLEVRAYRGGSLAIVLRFWNGDFWDIWTIVTIDLLFVCDQDCAYIDTQTNGKEIVDWLKRNKLVIRERAGFSVDGWSYPYCCFDPDVLKKFDPEGYDEYLECWKMYNECDE